ncbi:MAG: patatin-like phospholipase family protein [Treponema sp.]|nr:patatin-like phospholipase family protein [Treponema sp.]
MSAEAQIELPSNMVPVNGGTFRMGNNNGESEKRPKIALVLSGGAALGFAHVGFLKVLEEVGIPIDCIIGTSMGSLIGALYAAGYSPGDIERLAAATNWSEMFLNEGVVRDAALPGDTIPNFTLNFDKKGVGKSKGIFTDQNLTLLFSELMYKVSWNQDFAALPVPFRTNAVDIVAGEAVTLDHGALYRAMRASMSIPIVFPPVAMNGTYYVDGGIRNNNPIDLAREWGADIIIDIDVGSFVAKTPEEINSIDIIVDQSIRLIQSTNYISNLAIGDEDFRLVMDLSDFFWTDFAKAKIIIDRGETIARSSENMQPLLELAAKIEAGHFGTARELARRDWQRFGSYLDLPDPVFTRVRLVSIGANGAEESGQTAANQVSHKYLASFFANFFGKQVDSEKLAQAIEIVRRKGNYENVGYHLEAGEDGAYCLVLTGVKAAERKNDGVLTLSADLSLAETLAGGISNLIELNFRDFLFRRSCLNLKFSYAFSNMDGPSLSLGYTKTLSSLFQANAEMGGSYLSSNINAFQPEGELSDLGDLNVRAQFFYTPVDYFNLSLGYLYNSFWYENKEYDTASQATTNTDYLNGDMHSVEFGLHYNTSGIDHLLLSRFLGNIEFDGTVNFPFAGGRFSNNPAAPWYERFEIVFRKAWLPHPRRAFILDLNAGSYRGNLDPVWSFYDLSGKAGIPGYTAKNILGRDKGIAGFTYLEEIPPLSRLLSMRSFFALITRGGNVWDEFNRIERIKELRGGVRAGLQINTAIGSLFLGPEVSFDGKFQICLYFN